MTETFYIASTGNDSNSGAATNPLRNIWKVFALAPISEQVVINCLDAGPFDGAIDPAHRVFGVVINGISAKSVLRANENGTNLLTAQDHATVICHNLKLQMAAGVNGCNAGFARQAGILDIDNCDVGVFATHFFVDRAMLNITGLCRVDGASNTYVRAIHSRPCIAGNIQIHANYGAGNYFLTGTDWSSFDCSAAAFAVWGAVPGGQVNLVDSCIYKPAGYALPGNSSLNSLNSRSQIY